MSETSRLRDRWVALRGSLGEVNGNSESTVKWERYWDFLHENYSKQNRKYHTLRHLTELFWHYDRAVAEGWLQRGELVALAIFWHDVIYNGVNKADEDASADAFEEFGQAVAIKAEDVATVSEWIRLTATHTATVESHGKDCCFFMDFDMAILGKPWDCSWEGFTMEGPHDDDGYKEYALRDVVEEYRRLKGLPESCMPLFQHCIWCWGRAGFLRKTCTPFATAEYKQRYDEQAKRNMALELEHWVRVQARAQWAAALLVGTLGAGYAAWINS